MRLGPLRLGSFALCVCVEVRPTLMLTRVSGRKYLLLTEKSDTNMGESEREREESMG